ncbi:MAG: MltR family transcriptional regulator [Chryseobacterium sp.]|uniref:MltR family transcriptional regulator n=1 Tax=Chryseobacterium sp. TaxID=1871047 RepID=UPI003D0DCFEE
MINQEDNLEEKILKLFKYIMPSDKVTPHLVERLKEAAKFRNQLTVETARGSALFVGSYLESVLEKVLRSKLIGNEKHLNELLSFNGAIGSFSNKINVSYSIGLISKDILNDLNIIRKIRNEFGHSANIIDFEDAKISGLCNSLKLVARSGESSPRQKFNASVHYILGKLELEISQVEKFSEKTTVNDIDEKKKSVENILEIYRNLKSE